MNLDYQHKLTLDHKLADIPIEKHWISQMWYADSFDPEFLQI